MVTAEDKPTEELVLDQIVLAERVSSAIAETNSFREECGMVWDLVNELSLMLHDLIDFIHISEFAQPLYDRPIIAVVSEISNNLQLVLNLVRKCKRWTLFRRFGFPNRATEFCRVLNSLESSIADLEWLFPLFGFADGDRVIITLPPIAINDPVISWVWSYIAALKMGKLKDRINAAKILASLAKDNIRNKIIIKEEGGIPPLLKLLREKSPESQIAAADALCILSGNPDIARTIVNENGIPSIVNLLRTSTIRVQIPAAKLVARTAENNPEAQKEFAEEHVIGPLLKLLSFDLIPDEHSACVCKRKQSFDSVLDLHKEIHSSEVTELTSENHSFSCRFSNLYLNWYFEGSNRAKVQKEEWENEEPDVKLALKMNCSEALWMLARENVLISKNIIERNGLISLVKLVEKEEGELRFNCLMIVVEITATAERDQDFRKSVMKNKSSKALINQILRVIEESDDDRFQIPAIRSIGSLARIFPAKETRVIESLVKELSNKSCRVAVEAIIALHKFVCKDNYLLSAHSTTIIELDGLTALQELNQKEYAGVLIGEIVDASRPGSAKSVDRWSMPEEMERARRRRKRPQKFLFIRFRSFHDIVISFHDLLDHVENGKLVFFTPCSPLRYYE